MKGRLIAVFTLLAVVGVIGVSFARASNAAPCAGLSHYQTAMYQAGNAYSAALDHDGLRGRSPASLSSDEWATFADDALNYQKGLKRITPPDWANDWHQTQIAYAGLAQQMGLLASSTGFLSIAALIDQIDATAKDAADSAAIAAKGCADFAAFVIEWNQFLGIADPATPTP